MHQLNVTDVFTGRPIRTYFRDKQIHISADVAYGIRQYYLITGDDSVLFDGGAEVILECAVLLLVHLLQAGQAAIRAAGRDGPGRVSFRGQDYRVDATHREVTITASPANTASVRVELAGKSLQLAPGESDTVRRERLR